LAYEILNNAQVTPHRLHAFVRLVSRLQNPNREELLNLLQPTEMGGSQESSKEVYRAALNCGLITENSNKSKTVGLNVSPDQVESLPTFRDHLRQILLGVTDENSPNYLFNIFTAWYATQNERVFQLGAKGYEKLFNDQIFTNNEERAFNDTKLNGWRNWAAFLGLGWPMRAAMIEGQREVLVPDAHSRLKAVLPKLLSPKEGSLRFGIFARRLAEECPELDGGILFEICWKASRPSEQRGNRISLMLSTGLRVLHDTKAITLIRESDADEKWQMYQAIGYDLNQITHIQAGG